MEHNIFHIEGTYQQIMVSGGTHNNHYKEAATQLNRLVTISEFYTRLQVCVNRLEKHGERWKKLLIFALLYIHLHILWLCKLKVIAAAA